MESAASVAQPAASKPIGTFAAEHLSPSYPERAARGTADKLRAWQAEALDLYFETEPKDFLAAATPGAGKTTFALRLAAELLARRIVDRITVVAPTEHLKRQWADAAHRAGIRLNPEFKNGHAYGGRRFNGIVVTYAQVAVRAALHRQLTESARTLVILDEVHHGGDALSWGDAIREAFEPATRRLSLTGTPFRSDTAPIPFVTYLRDEHGIRLSSTDYNYGYGRALEDGVVRPVLFMAYAGKMRWRTRMGEEFEARLGQDDTKDVTAQAWRTALSPEGDWIPAVLTAADRRLTEVRHSIPDAGGLVIATDQFAARAYAAILTEITGKVPSIVLSDEKESSDRIEAFAQGDSRWMVAVRMVSEGVDVPRLAVGVYATSASTPLYFAQAIGRFVRSRRPGEIASIFLPSVPNLLQLASELEAQRNHVLGEPHRAIDDPLDGDPATRTQTEKTDTEQSFTSLGADAELDQVIFDGSSFGTATPAGSDEEADYLGIPGLLDAEQMRALLHRRQDEQLKKRAARSGPAAPAHASGITTHGQIRELRRELNALVSVAHHRTGKPHGWIHNELRRRCGGPPIAAATRDQLKARIDAVREFNSEQS